MTIERRSLFLLGTGGAIALMTLLLAFGLSRDPSQLRSNLEGRPAPDFTLRTLDGARTLHLTELRGQVVVINFWASWCAECRVEHAALASAWDRYRDQGVVLLGVSFDDSLSAAKSYAGERSISWPLVSDPGTNAALAYGISGVPETIFIGPDGRVASKHIGPVSDTLLAEQITSLLREKSG